jgi:hypothetical protein
MSVNIKVILNKSFLDTSVTEVLNLAVNQQALREIAVEIEQRGEYEIWVDSREAGTVLSMVDTNRLGNMLATHPSLHESKITLVTSVNDTNQSDAPGCFTMDPTVCEEVITGFENPRAVVASVNVN